MPSKQTSEKKRKLLENEKDPWRLYAYRRFVEDGEDAEKLFKF